MVCAFAFLSVAVCEARAEQARYVVRLFCSTGEEAGGPSSACG